jgi:hypothetical protein
LKEPTDVALHPAVLQQLQAQSAAATNPAFESASTKHNRINVRRRMFMSLVCVSVFERRRRLVLPHSSSGGVWDTHGWRVDYSELCLTVLSIIIQECQLADSLKHPDGAW